MRHVCTCCKGRNAREITVKIYFGPFAPGICDDCLDEMMKVVMSHISGGFWPRLNMELKDDQG